MSRPAPCRRPAGICLALAFLALWALPQRPAGAAGFEKATLWSAHYSGMADAAAADVVGPEAVYFNPAGLVGAPGLQLGVNLSPMFAKLQGQMPTTSTAQSLGSSGDRRATPLIGTLASLALSERWAAGLGFYVGGGIKAFYEDIDYTSIFPAATLRPTVKADLEITEFALGTAYQLAPDWKVGGALRVLHVNTDFSSVKVTGANSFQNVFFNDMKDTVYGGFRLGTQYADPSKRWGLGASWRSQVDFEAEGNVTAKVDMGGTVVDAPSGKASAKNSFPQQISVGGFYTLSSAGKMVGEYAWTEYSVDQVLDITGNLGTTSLDVVADIPQHWNNMHIVRLGTEYTGLRGWALRGGYAYTSQVTPDEYSRATFIAPGVGHTFTLGAGRRFSDKLAFDVAVDYSFSSGTGSNTNANPMLSENIAPGGFRSDAVTMHTGVTYAF